MAAAPAWGTVNVTSSSPLQPSQGVKSSNSDDDDDDDATLHNVLLNGKS